MAKRTDTDKTMSEFEENFLKRVSPACAEMIRTKRAMELMKVDYAVKPTIGVDSGANGKAFELLLAKKGSRKTTVSKQGKIDVFLPFMVNGKKRIRGVEAKTNGGELTSIYKTLEAKKDGIVCYYLDICNKNTGYQRRTVTPRIMKYSTFWSLLEACDAIRYGKPTTAGGRTIAIESSRAALPRLLSLMTEYDDSRDMDINEVF